MKATLVDTAAPVCLPTTATGVSADPATVVSTAREDTDGVTANLA